MAQANPWDAFPVAPAAGGPLASPPPRPPAARDPLQIRRDEIAIQQGERDLASGGAGKPPPGYRFTANGDLEVIPGGPAAAVPPKGSMEEARRNAELLLQAAGVDIARGIDPVSDLIEGSTSGRVQAFGAGVYGDVTGDATEGMENIAKLQTIVSDMTLQLTGGSLGNQISNADREFIMQRVGNLGDPTIPASQRLAAWEQVKQRMANLTAPAEGEEASPPLGALPQNIPGVGGAGEAPVIDAAAQTKNLTNPVLAGIRGRYIGLLEQNASPEEVVAFLRSVGVEDSRVLGQARAQAVYRRQNPRVPLDDYTFDFSEAVPLTERERGAAQAADNPVGAATVAAGDAFTGFNLDSIIGATGGNAEQARVAMGEIGERHPVASTVGTVAGGVAASLGAEAALGGRMAPGVARAMLGDAAYGGVAGAGMTDYADDGTPATLADRAIGAGKGVVAAGLGSGVGSGIGRGLQRTARGVSNPSVRAMQAEGIPLTVGQTVAQSGTAGKIVKGIEDRVEGLPVVGGMISARRLEGTRAMNTKAFDKGLEPIGGSVNGAVGADAVNEAQQQVQAAFSQALAGKAARADAQLGTDLTEASAKTLAIPRVGAEVGDNIQNVLAPYMTGTELSGEAMQAISRELRTLKAGYRAKEPALYTRIAGAIDDTEEAIFGLFRRQAPEVLPAYNAAKKAYRRVSILADAVNTADNQNEGLFTAAQLNRADKANARKYEGSISAAAGPRQFRDFGRAAQEVLPNKVPDSGTAGRLILPALAVGAVGTDAAMGGGVSGSTLTLAAVLAGAYTKAGQRLLTKPGRGMKPGKLRAVLENPKTRRAIAAGSGATALTTQQ